MGVVSISHLHPELFSPNSPLQEVALDECHLDWRPSVHVWDLKLHFHERALQGTHPDSKGQHLAQLPHQSGYLSVILEGSTHHTPGAKNKDNKKPQTNGWIQGPTPIPNLATPLAAIPCRANMGEEAAMKTLTREGDPLWAPFAPPSLPVRGKQLLFL